ncbi:hypothetical protein HDV00_000060 [Rhizophlyctis rosea]|nr:hypothetical protein HDV00_000060 [Rhizophlyctis rosea]
MATHTAVIIPSQGEKPSTSQVPTPAPGRDELLLRVTWVALTPADVWIADHGLGDFKPPVVLGENFVAVVERVGEGVDGYEKGDKVLGFQRGENKYNALQQYIVASKYNIGKVPINLTDDAATSTVPDNLVTAINQLTSGGVQLPIHPSIYPTSTPIDANIPILVWGGATSVGQFTIQILAYSGYKTIITTASPPNHALLRSLGATHIIAYGKERTLAEIRNAAGGRDILYALDCVGDEERSLKPIAEVVATGGKVAYMLPVLRKGDGPGGRELAWSVDRVNFKEGVETIGVRTFLYHKDAHLKETLQPVTVPRLLAEGVVVPQKVWEAKGADMRERLEIGLDELRKGLSAQRVVLKVD